MVLIFRPTHRLSSIKLVSIWLSCLGFYFSFVLGRILEQNMVNKPSDNSDFEQDWADRNAKRMKEQRQRFKKRIKESIANNSGAYITKLSLRPCPLLFLDLGSNIGDAVHKVIDSFLPEIEDGYFQFNTTTGYLQVEHESFITPRILSRWVHERISQHQTRLPSSGHQHSFPSLRPEHYCFYGIEGNPHFTATLQQMELDILHMDPRPLRYIHFLTEYVTASQNGPTTMFLDTTNTKMNYWGSSLFKTHVDVQNSGNITAVPVMGVTLTKLLEQTVMPGGHVMIKIDVEGAEYAVLEEAIQSNIFCKLVKEMGVTVDIIMEEHSAKTLGNKEPRTRWESIIQGEKAIRACGVDLQIPKTLIPVW
jgi:FkbM family methyltransferase